MKKTILVVDDDHQICRLLVAILKDFQVLTAHSSVEAMEILQSPKIVNLVITDRKRKESPDAGIHLMEQCDFIGTPVLMMSATGPTTKEECQIVAGRFVHKPFTIKELFGAIESALGDNENVENYTFHEASVPA